MTNEEAIKDIKENILPIVGGKSLLMAIAALEGKDTNVPTNSALDHIHNVVAEREYQRGYEQAKEKYEQGKAETNHPEIPDSCNAETVEAIPVDWIHNYISNLKDMGVQLSLRDAQAVSVMVDKWAMEQNGNATCGPDYCEIGGEHND